MEADREAQIKVAEDRLTKKFDDEVREVRQAFEESRGANPTTRDTTWMRDVMTEAVVAANNASLHTQKPYTEKGLFTMHAHRFGMNFEETIVGKLAEVYQTVHLKEFTDFPKKDEKDPTTVFTDIHFEKKSVAYEAYHLSHGLCL